MSMTVPAGVGSVPRAGRPAATAGHAPFAATPSRPARHQARDPTPGAARPPPTPTVWRRTDGLLPGLGLTPRRTDDPADPPRRPQHHPRRRCDRRLTRARRG